MTKSQLTHIIKEIVAEEIRNELPNAIAEVFQNFMGQRQPVQERVQHTPPPPPPQHPQESHLKQSLRELFAGTNVMPERAPQTAAPKKFAKDPLLNEILNQTRPFNAQERAGSPANMAAILASVQSNAMAHVAAPAAPMMEMGEIEEPAYMRGIPNMEAIMGHPSAPPLASVAPPVSQEALLKDDHAPMANLPEGVSALDLARVAGGDDPVTKALTKNYSGFLKKVSKVADQRKGIA